VDKHYCGYLAPENPHATRSWETIKTFFPNRTIALENDSEDILFQLSPSYDSIWHYRPSSNTFTRIIPKVDRTTGPANAYVEPWCHIVRNLVDSSVMMVTTDWKTDVSAPTHPYVLTECFIYDSDFDWLNSQTPYNLPWRSDNTFQFGVGNLLPYQSFYYGSNQPNLSTPSTWFPLAWVDGALYIYSGPIRSWYDKYDYQPGRAFGAVQWTPRYYYWTGSEWLVTCDKNKAWASPKTITNSSEAHEISDGIRLTFGPTDGTTYTQNEFHTINACWGKVKYVRQARYVGAIFTGETHSYTETKTMDSQRAMSFRSISGLSFTLDKSNGETVSGAIWAAPNFRFPKRSGSNWNIDLNSGVYPRITITFASPTNFSDITLGTAYGRGNIWEVSTDGVNFTPITPLWRGRNGQVWGFPRQENVLKVRHTCKQPQTYSVTEFIQGGYSFYDYGTQAQINAARLGNSSATNGDPSKGSWDPSCIGIATCVAVLSIDGGSVFMNSPAEMTDPVGNFYNNATVGVNTYKLHPYYGFVLFEGAGANGALSTKPGTNVTISYFWGRKA
jgi:hypothetical protein